MGRRLWWAAVVLVAGLFGLGMASRFVPTEQLTAASALVLGTLGIALFGLATSPRVPASGAARQTSRRRASALPTAPGPRAGGENLST